MSSPVPFKGHNIETPSPPPVPSVFSPVPSSDFSRISSAPSSSLLSAVDDVENPNPANSLVSLAKCASDLLPKEGVQHDNEKRRRKKEKNGHGKRHA